MELEFENVRGFSGSHVIPLKPLTILVGENSTGKSTVLAMLSAALSSGFPQSKALFSTAPFELGGYDSIATYRGGKYGRAKSFSIGISDLHQTGKRTRRATYVSRQGQPAISHFRAEAGKEYADVSFDQGRLSGSVHYFTDQRLTKLHGSDFSFDLPIGTDLPANFDSILITAIMGSSANRNDDNIPARHFERIFELLTGSLGGSAIAIAPVRTKPRRTYDEMTDDFKPEGDHIPLMLAHLPVDATNTKAQRVWNAVRQFGADSGLFSELNVKLLGPRASDPFQIRVKTVGPRVNLADVGYGVSQSLPILMESVLAPKGVTLLIQQPEVHLHPRAQAALGTLFTRLAHDDGKKFVLETHSDYLVDRIRIEISAGKISHNNVQILFFERAGIDSQIHVLGVDPSGSITNAPPTFRSFFLREDLKLLTRGD